MLIEISKTGFVNKGAELMLHAIVQQLAEHVPEVDVAVAPGGLRASSFQKRARLGLYQKAWLWKTGVNWGGLAGLLPPLARQMYGIVLDREVDVVLDAAGFSYSDQWGGDTVHELARSARRWRQRGTRVILLPQAFGPFGTAKIRRELKDAIDNIDLVFARDETSYAHLVNAVGEQPKIRIAPDFTNLLAGIPPVNDWMKEKICVVPNSRMIDKTDGDTASGYAPFLARCIRLIEERGRGSFLLVHEGEGDFKLAKRISELAGGVEIVREHDPLRIKGILGASFASVGSRFHGLVSAMSQGVPTLGTGWSHKYAELFGDYGAADLLVDVSGSEERLAAALDRITNEQARVELVSVLQARSEVLKAKSAQMWSEVFTLIAQNGA